MYEERQEEKVRKYSCKNCGQPFEAYPPDDVHTHANVLDKGSDWIELTSECKNCKFKNILYWTS